MLRRFSIRRRPSVKTFHVHALDGTTLSFNLDSRSVGKDLLDKVLQECAINSADRLYFSLATQEDNYLKWISLHKPLKKQLSGHSPYTLLFRVYIYPYNHHSLVQSLTRHYLYLQIKQDLKQNRLQPSSSTAMTRITSLMVQGEIGNYIPHTCSNGYIKELQLLPALTSGMEEAIKQAHRLNRGRLPGECEEEVLDLAQEEPTYGSVYYNIQDSHRQPVTVCVCPVGVRVAQGGRQINCFKWESITKVTCRGKHVYVQMDASQTLSAYQVHYICHNSAMAATIATWCQTLLNFYCSIDQEDSEGTAGVQSKLKRFFSTRRSLRRTSNRIKRTAAVPPGSIPVQRRSRRASVGGNFHDTGLSGDGSSRPANKDPLKREDSKLVIYGLSGLASQEDAEQTTHANQSDHSSSEVHSPPEVIGAVDSSDLTVYSSSNLHESNDATLPVIQEELGSNHSGLSNQNTLNRREGFPEDTGSSSKRNSYAGNQNSPRTTPQMREGYGGDRSPPKREGYGGEHTPLGDRSPPKKREGYGGSRSSSRGNVSGERTPPTKREGYGGSRSSSRSNLSGERTPPTRREDYHSSSNWYHGSPARRSLAGENSPANSMGEKREMPNRRSSASSHDSPNRRDSTGDQGYPIRSDGYGEGVRGNHISHTEREESRYQTGRLNSSPGGVTGSMPSLKREPPRRDGGYRGSYSKLRSDHQLHWNSPTPGSVGDVEHKSISSLPQKNTSMGDHHRDHQRGSPPPPLPPRTYNSETELVKEDRSYNYAVDCRNNSSPHHHRSYKHRGLSHNGGVVSPPYHHGGHRDRLSSSNRSSPQLYHHHSSHSSYPPNQGSHPSPQSPPSVSHPSPESPLHQSLHHHSNYPRSTSSHSSSYGGPSSYGRSSPYQYPSRGHHSPQHLRPPQQNSSSSESNSPSYHHQPPPYHSPSHSARRTYNSRGDDPHFKPPNYRYGLSSSQGAEESDRLSYNSYQEEIMNEGREEYNSSAVLKKRGLHYSSAGGMRPGEARSSLRAYRRRNSQGDTVASENFGWEYRHGEPERRHFKYPVNSGGRNQQAWKGGHRVTNGNWQDDEDTISQRSSSLPLNANPEYSLYEEEEEMEEEHKYPIRRKVSPHDQVSLHESGHHVSRHKRLRHSTITSLTSLPSDISGGMSRLGSIASLDYQASFAELSQADSISGYIDPHVRSLVFEASQNSQGTEL